MINETEYLTEQSCLNFENSLNEFLVKDFLKIHGIVTPVTKFTHSMISEFLADIRKIYKFEENEKFAENVANYAKTIKLKWNGV